MTKTASHSDDQHAKQLVRTHLKWGWVSLLVFLSLGIILEILHGMKVGWYLDVSNETRRMMWTLSHTHGTLVALVHLAFAATVAGPVDFLPSRQRLISLSMIGAGIFLPAGFFFGGFGIRGGDPGMGVLLVPIGAALLLVAVLFTAIAALRPQGAPRASEPRNVSRDKKIKNDKTMENAPAS